MVTVCCAVTLGYAGLRHWLMGRYLAERGITCTSDMRRVTPVTVMFLTTQFMQDVFMRETDAHDEFTRATYVPYAPQREGVNKHMYMRRVRTCHCARVVFYR